MASHCHLEFMNVPCHSLSSLMVEVMPNNNDLLAGAKAAARFVLAHMLNGNLPELFISANVSDNCGVNSEVDPSFPGWFVYGLSTIADITKEQDLIDQ